MTREYKLANLEDLQKIRDQAVAFAVQLFDQSSGARLTPQWVDDPGLVAELIRGIDAEAPFRGVLSYDPMQTAWVQTAGGEVFAFELAKIGPEQRGYLVLTDGFVRTKPAVATILAAAYGIADYDTGKLAALEIGAAAAPDEQLAPTRPSRVPRGDKTEIALFIYQDNPGAVFLKKYAESHAAGAKSEAFGVDGLNSLVVELRRLAGQAKVVKTLVLAVHGSPASFRLGKKNTPFQSATRVGFYPNQTTPRAFVDAIKAYLTKGARVCLLSCEPARNGGTPETEGQKFLQLLADLSDGTLSGSDAVVTISGAKASTEGNLYTATPKGGAPKITKAAPAGNIDP